MDFLAEVSSVFSRECVNFEEIGKPDERHLSTFCTLQACRTQRWLKAPAEGFSPERQRKLLRVARSIG
jgi:hypothetical protein